jgi:hypothetical protein
MIGFKGRFCLKQYLHGKLYKWGIKAWGLADRANGYLLNVTFTKEKKKFNNKTFY